MRIYKSIPKRLLALCLVFATGIGLGCLSDHFISENSRFQAFTDELFQSEVSNNTLTLHYTLANPSKKGIKKPEATLGTVLSDSDKTTNICQKYEKKLPDSLTAAAGGRNGAEHNVFMFFTQTCSNR